MELLLRMQACVNQVVTECVKIEPPSAPGFARIARSALHTYETQLHQQVLAHLPPAYRAALDGRCSPQQKTPIPPASHRTETRRISER